MNNDKPTISPPSTQQTTINNSNNKNTILPNNSINKILPIKPMLKTSIPPTIVNSSNINNSNSNNNNNNSNNNNMNVNNKDSSIPIYKALPIAKLPFKPLPLIKPINNNISQNNNNSYNVNNKPTTTTTTSSSSPSTSTGTIANTIKPIATTSSSVSSTTIDDFDFDFDGVSDTNKNIINPQINNNNFNNNKFNNNNNMSNNNKFNNNNIVNFQQRIMIPIDLAFKLINPTEFSCADPNNVTIRQVFEKIENARQFDDNWWVFPIFQHNKLYELLMRAGGVNVKPLPKHILMAFAQPPKPLNIDYSKLPTNLLNTLLPFQRKGIEFGVSKDGICIIGDEMGLGKTIQAIGLSYYYRNEWPLLIITPSSLRMGWAEQLEKFLPGVFKSGEINLVMNGKCGFNGLVNIVSYDLVRNKVEQVLEKRFKVVIADESHFLKDFKAKRTKETMRIMEIAKRKILLTGTPAISRPCELYQQIYCILPNFQKWYDYTDRYCAAHLDRYGRRNYFGLSNPVELNLFLEKIMIRRKKDEVLTELPEMRREKIMVEVKKSEMKKIKAVMENIKASKTKMDLANGDRKSVNSEGGRKKSLYTQLFRDTGLGKMAAISTFIEDKLEDGSSKLLIFAHHKTVMDGIEQIIKKKKVEFIRIDGTTQAHARGNLVTIFQTQVQVRVALLSITAAGTGLTLTAANVAIFAELYWTPGTLMQAEARIHRYGQNRSVLIQYLVGINTIDESIWSMLESKKDVLGRILDGESDTLDFEKGDQILQSEQNQSEIWENIIKSVEERDAARKKKIDARKERQKRKEMAANINNNEGEDAGDGSYLDEFLDGNDNEDEEPDEDNDEDEEAEADDDIDDNTTTKKKPTKAKSKKPAAKKKTSSTKSTRAKKTKDDNISSEKKRKNGNELLNNDDDDEDLNNLSGFGDGNDDSGDEDHCDDNQPNDDYKEKKSKDLPKKKQRLSSSSEIIVDIDEDFEDSLLVSDFDKLQQFKFKAGF